MTTTCRFISLAITILSCCLLATTTHAWVTTTPPFVGSGARSIRSPSSIIDTGSTSTRSTGGSSSSTQLHIFRRITDSLTSKERSREDLKLGIAGFYDRSSKLWENIWGEHMHHGYYIPENRTDHVQAQIDLIDEVLKWADVNPAAVRSVVDVGCGIGGSSRHIARKYGCTTEGITLSPYQAKRGNELAVEQNVAGQCNFQVADALDMPFLSNRFDLVWSLESGEHMPDKEQFVNELVRVCKPDGKILVVTWCHRDLEPGEEELERKELKLLNKINRAYYLPKWCSVQDYIDMFEAKGCTDVRREDWSYIIAPFWKAVIRSTRSPKSVFGLMTSGFSTLRGAYAMLLMLKGFDKGLIKFGLITCTKPQPKRGYLDSL
jgi:tocopherol O-methyltransferase